MIDKPSDDAVFCEICTQWYDPKQLDQVAYHALEPHGQIFTTGIIGEEVEPDPDKPGEWRPVKPKDE